MEESNKKFEDLNLFDHFSYNDNNFDRIFDNPESNSNFLDSTENPFCVVEQNEKDSSTPTRNSGNLKTLFHKMTHGDIKEEIMSEVRKCIITNEQTNALLLSTPSDMF